MKSTPIVAMLLLFQIGLIANAEDSADWPRWRGPLDNGSVESGAYPVSFSGEKFEWKSQLPGKGCSTPIVWKQTIYVTAPAEGKDSLLAFDWSGKLKWQASFGQEDAGRHRNGSGSNASPVTDGESVFVYFKSGTLAGVDFEGNTLWKTNLVERFGKDTLYWDHGTSPVLTKSHVIMTRMHEGDSWLAAFNKQTGKMDWKVARNYKTPQECDHGYATPLVIQYQKREALLLWGAQHLTIHDAASGKQIWACGDFNPESHKLWPSIATPVVVGDVAVIAYGRNDRKIPRLHGIRLTGEGDVTASNHLWKREDVGTFVPSPAAYQGKVYLVGDRGKVECLEPATGKTVWSGSLPKHRASYYASPLIAGGILYAPREDGVVQVARISNGKLELLSENDMGESIIGSPVPVANRILLRGERNLFCLSDR